MLYTRSGDDGYTRLLGKDKVPKYDLRPEAYGAVDEASSFMGLVRADPAASERTRQLICQAQRDLWMLMGELAAALDVELPQRITAERVTWLEIETDKLAAEFPPLNQFVLPGDIMIGARLDVARTVVRRAERYIARLLHENLLGNKEIFRYLNRLSSLLFALARYEEHLAGQKTTLTKNIGSK
ncbi:MAG: cob(I)yrinic acid a,c-diamide adenosyltransferase [Anaerolineae bacterium]|nr:cob(I)yrinic acid a,c-diamide adenosyltransferase [Anaerolineae bacterium]